MKHLSCLFLILCASVSYAQPATDIWLLDIEAGAEIVLVRNLVNITDRVGYDNQPHFTPDGKYVLYTSMRDGKQSDIYSFQFRRRRTKQLTCTTESEYSPVTIPGKKEFSVVRVEKDSAQQLRIYKRDECDEGERLLPETDSIGYYAWLEDEHIALFILGNPHYLRIMDLNGNTKVEYQSIGRSLHKIPGTDKVSFVWKRSDTDWWLCSLDAYGNLRKLSTLEAPYEDYGWLPDGRIAWAKGSQVLIAPVDQINSGATFSFDLSAYGIKNISRVTVNGDASRMCVVSEE